MKNLVEKKELIERMHALIKRRGTGTPADFAKRLNLSRSSLHRHIEAMRAIGAPIIYSITRQTYEYEYEVNFQMGFESLSNLTEQEKREVGGGTGWKNLEYFSSFFPSVKK